MNPIQYRSRIVRAFRYVVPAFTAGLTFAQQTPAAIPAEPKPTDDEVVVLSPFQVNSANDSGYRTRDIVTGTKIATPLNESPLTVGVINKELFDDTNLRRVQDAVAFTQAGVSDTGKGFQDKENYVFRGYNGQILRNGVIFDGYTDASNIERVEIAKGPSAILYGFVAPGGVVNYVTKKPFDGKLFTAKLEWGSETGLREEYDYNTRLFNSDKVLFRVTGSQTDGDTWLRYQTLHDTVINPNLTIKLTDKTTVNYDFSYRQRKGPFERIGAYTLLTNGTSFNTIAVSPYNDQLGGNVDYDQNPGIASFTWAKWLRRRSEIRIEHTFNEHFTFLGIMSDDYGHQEQLTQFQNFAARRDKGYENVFLPPPEHILLSVMPIYENVQWHKQYLEASFLARFETAAFKSSTIAGLQANREPTNFPDSAYYAPDVSKIGVIDYTLASPYTVRMSDPLSKREYRPDLNYKSWQRWFSQNNVTDWDKPDLYITENLAALDNKLHVLAGFRRQQYKALKVERNLPQFGAIYQVAKGISVYGIWSKTAEDNGRTLRYQQPRPLSESKAYDIGVKFELLDSKLTGGIAYFDINKTNLAVTDSRAIIDYAAGLVDDTVTFTPGTESKGVEVNIQYQPNQNFQAIFSYAHTDAQVLKGDPNPLNDGTALTRAIPDAITLYAKYTFTSGPLNKLSLGAGLVQNWGPIWLGPPAARNIKLDGYMIMNAFARYQTRICDRRVSFQVSVNNLTDERYVGNGGWNAPREFFLSTDVKF
jgi:iron complex outermembrane receptor protein